ncbi:DUF3015 family protein [Salinisphaera sp. SWV1]|uniref:DUF3015 family protein n=1 Tax=Salinisphaera sp. SWV1 TaxID=3454139 RepID=UPI003F85F27F
MPRIERAVSALFRLIAKHGNTGEIDDANSHTTGAGVGFMLHLMIQSRLRRPVVVIGLMGALLLLAGCTALSSTTRRAGQASVTTLKGMAHVSRATSHASVTRPDVPRYADADAFVRSQRRQLARQAAAGGGEDIDALAVLLRKPDNRALARWMQAHYHALFSDRSVSASTIVSRIDAQAG